MPRATKMKYIIFMMMLYLGGYVTIQAGAASHKFDFLTSYDMAIPFMPDFIWVYHSIFPAITLSLLLMVKTREVFLATFWACIIAAVVLNISYIAFPSYYPREAFEITSLSTALVEWTRQIDGSNNTFPSGHVTFSWILFLGIWGTKLAREFSYVRFLYLLWVIAVSLSTLVLKQHYIVDVFSGIILALTCFYLATPIIALCTRLVTNDVEHAAQ